MGVTCPLICMTGKLGDMGWNCVICHMLSLLKLRKISHSHLMSPNFPGHAKFCYYFLANRHVNVYLKQHVFISMHIISVNTDINYGDRGPQISGAATVGLLSAMEGDDNGSFMLHSTLFLSIVDPP